MAKGRRLISETLKKMDMAIQILDARIPQTSMNPLLNRMLKGKPGLFILNKADLADTEKTRAWARFLKKENREILICEKNRKEKDRLLSRTCRHFFREKTWIDKRPIRALVVGIPNVGKSSFINDVSRSRKTAVGKNPGKTRDLKQIHVSSRLDLFDTPGMLWHKFSEKKTGIKLALLGAINPDILPVYEMALYLLEHLPELQEAPFRKELQKRYGIQTENTPEEVLEAVARTQGALRKGGLPDLDRASQIILTDLKEGRLGRISLESPGHPIPGESERLE